MKNLYRFFCIMVFFITGYTQTVNSQSLSSYAFIQSSAAYTPISGTSAGISGDDVTSVALPIGFNFNYCGTMYSTVKLCTNGWLNIGATSTSNSFYNNLGGIIYANFLCPYWDDLFAVSASDIQYTTSGTSPNRVFTAQWGPNVYSFSGGSSHTYNFQVKLYETSNVVQFCYGPINFNNNGSGSIGLMDQSGNFVSVSPGNPATTSMTIANNNISTFSNTNLVYSFSTSSMVFSSSTTTQNTLPVGVGEQNAQIIGLQVVTTGLINPLSMTGITFSTSGSSNSADLTNTRVFYTGNSSTFATTTQFGATITDPGGSFTVTGNMLLSQGTNYFWLVYDISGLASVGDVVDAECSSFTIGSVVNTPLITAPTGNRTITLIYCHPAYSAGSDCSSGDWILNFWTTGGLTNISNLNTDCISSPNNYIYYNNMSASVIAGDSVVIHLQSGASNAEYFGVWIDLNNDGDFTDNGEAVWNSGSNSTTVFAGTIFIPAGTVPGTHRMRIICNPALVPSNPCGSYSMGETADYDLIIQELSGCTDPAALNYNPLASVDDGSCTYPPCNADAGFSYNNDGILTVSVAAMADTALYSVTWAWGDGFTGNGATDSHTYSTAGSYNITCIVYKLQYPNCSDTVSIVVTLTGPHPDWSFTITNSNHIILFPVNCNITIDSMPVIPGDYIGVFYNNNGSLTCGGYIMYTGQTEALTAWGDDPQTPELDGFTTGEEFHWKIWQAASNYEYDAIAVYLPIGAAGINNQQFYAVNGTSGISSMSYVSSQTQILALPTGWSIISTYILPFTSNCFDIFNPVIDDVIIAKNKTGAVFWPHYEMNSIGNFVLGEGYQLKMNVNRSLDLTGHTCLPQNSPINISEGWSIIGYLRQSPASIIAIMSSIVNYVIIVKEGDGNIYWPAYGVNNIGNLQPGKGYQIKTNASCILTYPPNSLNLEKSDVLVPSAQYFGVPRNTGNNMTLGLMNDGLGEMNDEIGVFDTNGLLIGSSVIESNFTAITLWGDDELTPGKDGLADGEPFIIKLWNKETGDVEIVNVIEWIEGNGNYQPNAICTAGNTELLSTSRPQLFQNIPNPFNGYTEIGFYLSSGTFAELTVYNAIGEIVETLCNENLSIGNHNFRFYSADHPSGVYFYRLRTNEYMETKAMNMSK